MDEQEELTEDEQRLLEMLKKHLVLDVITTSFFGESWVEVTAYFAGQQVATANG